MIPPQKNNGNVVDVGGDVMGLSLPLFSNLLI